MHEAGSAGRIANLLAEEAELAGWFAGGIVDQFADAAQKAGIPSDADDAPIALARHLAESAGSTQQSAIIAVVARAGEAIDGERYSGEIAFCLNLDGTLHERNHRVEANHSELRRRAALWASEFLHVTLATA